MIMAVKLVGAGLHRNASRRQSRHQAAAINLIAMMATAFIGGIIFSLLSLAGLALFARGLYSRRDRGESARDALHDRLHGGGRGGWTIYPPLVGAPDMAFPFLTGFYSKDLVPFLLFFTFANAAVAETNRAPFDLPGVGRFSAPQLARSRLQRALQFSLRRSR